MSDKIKKKYFVTYSFIFFVIFSLTPLNFFNFGVYANNNLLINVFSTNETIEEPYDEYNLLSNIDDFVKVPKGGVHWKVFGETIMKEYTFFDKEGNEWIGVRPEFKDQIKKLDKQNILIQGYMFPLEQDEKQKLFLLGPFPISCPYHPHISANLIIEVHAENPIVFSYDAVNIKGKLELVPKDDDYNVFFSPQRCSTGKLDLLTFTY